MSARPTLSVIVPTLNGENTLGATLSTLLEQDTDRVEVLVSDNISSDNSAAVAKGFAAQDVRFTTLQPPNRLSMSRHWEFALSHATGDYVSFIGDDDGVVPGGLSRALRLLEEAGWPDALNSVNCEYHWPSSPIKNQASVLRVPRSKVVRGIKSAEALASLARGKIVYTELPMIYRGLVKRAVLDRLRSSCGAVFRSCQPDIYSGVAVAASTRDYYFSEEPLFIEGVSGSSNGANSVLGPLVSDEAFFVHDTIPFHASLPYCPATPFLVSESLLQAHDAGLIDSKALMRKKRIIADTLIVAKNYSKERYSQCILAAESFAQSTHNTRAFTRLRSKHRPSLDRAPALPPVAAWVDYRYGKYPSLSVRTDLASCKTVKDIFDLLDPKNAVSDAKMNLFTAIAEDRRYRDYDQLTASKAHQLSAIVKSPEVRLLLRIKSLLKLKGAEKC